jgi:hypothetical protein
MEEATERENTKLDQILESLDLVFSRLIDVGVQHQQMKKHLVVNTQLVDQHTTD